MRERLLPHYRGIVIAGTAGSGKTTLANALVRHLADAHIIEASACVIGPALTFRTLPRTATAFLRAILASKPSPVATDERVAAKELNQELRRHYGADIIARALSAVIGRDATRSVPIIVGVRGNDTMDALRKLGFFAVFLHVPERIAVPRLMRRDSIPRATAVAEIRKELRMFNVAGAKRHADLYLVLDDGMTEHAATATLARITIKECRRCVNTTANPSITVGHDGLCSVCAWYADHFNATKLKMELALFKKLRGTGKGRYDIAVGISGGKDSTAMLATVLAQGFTPITFTLDTGYYPAHSFTRARAVAKQLGVDWVRVDIRPFARVCDQASFQKTAALYDLPETAETARLFRDLYRMNREHYAITCTHAMPFVRSCILCRRLVIRAYFALAKHYGVRAVALGMNEWTGLSGIGKRAVVSALRELRPRKGPAVQIVHVPYLFRRKRADTARILKKLGWKTPTKESFVESNANSCLFALAAEAKAARMLGFHPDTTRLAREVTAGFLTKREATKALTKTHVSKKTVRAVLKKARLI